MLRIDCFYRLIRNLFDTQVVVVVVVVFSNLFFSLVQYCKSYSTCSEHNFFSPPLFSCITTTNKQTKTKTKKKVLDELQHYSESWVGMELTAHQAYGFRLYRNNSQLQMHVDKSQTHIVSFILHIDSSDDAEPWPILIEDYNGSKYLY